MGRRGDPGLPGNPGFKGDKGEPAYFQAPTIKGEKVLHNQNF